MKLTDFLCCRTREVGEKLGKKATAFVGRRRAGAMLLGVALKGKVRV